MKTTTKTTVKSVYELVAGDVVCGWTQGRSTTRTVETQAFNGRGMYAVKYTDGTSELLNAQAVRTVAAAS